MTRFAASRIAILLLAGIGAPGLADESGAATPWRGVHVMAPSIDDLPLLKRAIDEALVPLGVDALVLEVGYGFQFESHPELGNGSRFGRAQARDLAAFCKQRGIRLIPLFNCLGHQSWAGTTAPLLRRHPEFDETPGVPPDNEGIYCRSWCPQHPEVNAIVFALIDELIDAFEADAVHVGMDEVFLIASPQCSRCRGKDPATLFAKAVIDLHTHVVGTRKKTMLMWGDRLLEDATMRYGEWESSRNGTAAAVDHIPNDIIICDWHYEKRDDYPSVKFFQDKGFRVWPSSWRKPDAAQALLEVARKDATPRMLGHLGTSWVGARDFSRALLGEPASDNARGAAESLRACMKLMAP